MKYTSSTIIRRKLRKAPWRRAAHRVLCVALLLALLPAASFASGVPTNIRVAFVSPEDLQLYPLRMMDRDMLSIMDMVYEGLIRIDDDRRPQLGLATSFSVLSDGRTWTFTLREDVLFHDGRTLKASDVCATMDAIKIIAEDPNIPDNEKGLYALLPLYCRSWKAEDDYTLTVQANPERSYYGMLYAMTFPILQAQSIYQENPPGTGPYRLEYYVPGQEIWLAGNQAWSGGPPPHVSELTCIWYPSYDAALQAFEAEDVDVVMTRSMAATRYRGTSSTRADSYMFATQQLECLLMNSYRELRDPKMRQAIAHAIDKTRLMNNTYQGVITSTDTLQVPGTWLYNNDAKTYRYDQAAANALLDELGWDQRNDQLQRIKRSDTGETQVLELRMYYYDEAGTSLRKEAANEIATMLRAVGFRIRVTPYSFEDGASKLKNRDYDLFLCAYNMDRVPDPSFLLNPTGSGNYVYYRSDDMKKLCSDLRSASDEGEFQQYWMQIQELMANDIPFLPLYWREGIVLTRYPYSNVRDIREFELLRGIERYQ